MAQTAYAVHDPVGFFRRNGTAFGPVFRARFVGVPRMVYVGTPALADRVLRTDRDVGRAGEARQDFLEPLVGPESVLCLEGEPWLRERRRLGPAFHGRRLASYPDMIASIVEAEVARWPVGKVFALRPRMQRITLEVIFAVVFGPDGADARSADPNAANAAPAGEPAAAERRRRLRALLSELIDVAASPVLAYVPPRLGTWLEESAAAQRLPRNTVAGFYRLKSQVDELLLAEIRDQREHGTPDGGGVLGMLAAVPDATDSQIRDELITLWRRATRRPRRGWRGSSSSCCGHPRP